MLAVYRNLLPKSGNNNNNNTNNQSSKPHTQTHHRFCRARPLRCLASRPIWPAKDRSIEWKQSSAPHPSTTRELILARHVLQGHATASCMCLVHESIQTPHTPFRLHVEETPGLSSQNGLENPEPVVLRLTEIIDSELPPRFKLLRRRVRTA